MKIKSLALLAIAFYMSEAIHGQLFHPLGLDTGLGERVGEYSQPRMHVEGNTLYVCTQKGLYSKDLSSKGDAWQLVGFKDVPLQDYARRGEDILALRYNNGGSFLLLSHDGGQTFEDITPNIFCQEKYEVLPSLAQSPTSPNELIISSLYGGIFRSTDFGQTWKNVTEALYGNGAASFIGFHPTRPSIIYNSGEGSFFEGHINISYDSGQIWNDHGNSLGFSGDNCVHSPAFHPTNPDCWLVGGEGCVFLTNDNGQTWNVQNFDKTREGYWFFSVFDEEHPDIVYMAGNLDAIMVMYSMDGGRSWNTPQTAPTEKMVIVNDFQQYGDKLLIYAETDVYEVSKSELIAQGIVPVRSVTTTSDNHSELYDLSGRRISVPSVSSASSALPKGVYIRNGRKVVMQ